MFINEVDSSMSVMPRLVALTEFLLGRAKDTNAKKQISTEAFLKHAANLGIALSVDQLQSMLNKPPLSELIDPTKTTNDTIVFKTPGDQDKELATMPVDREQKTVSTMAKRAAKKAT